MQLIICEEGVGQEVEKTFQFGEDNVTSVHDEMRYGNHASLL